MIRKILFLFLILLSFAILFIIANTFSLKSRQIMVEPVRPMAFDEHSAAEKLAESVRFKTISLPDETTSYEQEFTKLHAHLERSYPIAHQVLQKEVIGKSSLLYTWQGSDLHAKPIALLAHQDVVPIAPDTLSDWQVPPFTGTITKGFIWGRGAWDNKSNLLGMLHAIDLLAQSGFKPKRTLYIVAGHDEEIGGEHGAKAIAAKLQAKGVKLDFVLDEGLLITHGILKGIDSPIALIGIAEKGYMSVHLESSATPGHSSMPPQTTAIGSMSRALTQLERQQFPAHISGIAKELLQTIAPEMTLPNRIVLSNLWLTAPFVRAQFENSPSTNALIRTTTALTLVNAGNKDNVLPGRAQATVNFRLLPGDEPDDVIAHVKRVIADNAIQASSIGGFYAPSPISPCTSTSYQAINRTIRQVFPQVVIAPGLMLASTDSKHFQALSDNIYRFSPIHASAEDLPRFHGTNERISIQNYADIIRFYRQLLINVNAAPSN